MPTSASFQWQDGKTVTQKQLAEICGVTVRTIRRYLQDPDAPTDSLDAFVSWRFTKDIIVATEGDYAEMNLDQLKIAKLRSEARKAEHEANRSGIGEDRERFDFAVQKGEYVERDVILINLANVSIGMRDLLFALPDKVASRVMGCESLQEVVEVLKAELTDLAQEVDSWTIVPEKNSAE